MERVLHHTGGVILLFCVTYYHSKHDGTYLRTLRLRWCVVGYTALCLLVKFCVALVLLFFTESVEVDR